MLNYQKLAIAFCELLGRTQVTSYKLLCDDILSILLAILHAMHAARSCNILPLYTCTCVHVIRTRTVESLDEGPVLYSSQYIYISDALFGYS